jgi:predicted nucleic-acid-binding Zn-ribbon protein
MSVPPTMPPIPTAEQIKLSKALDVLRERGALRDDTCPECRHHDWHVDFVAIAAMPLSAVESQAGQAPPGAVNLFFSVRLGSTTGYIPALTLTCTTCGYTKIFNLNKIGLTG